MTNPSKKRKKVTRKSPEINTALDLTDTSGEGLWIESGFTMFVWAFALATAGTLFWISAIIFKDAWPAISNFGLSFLWNPKWDIGELQFGALPFIYGTVISSAIAIIIALPLGLSVAIVTSENFLPPWVRSPLGFMVELISAIPSVIVGLWGIFVLIPFLLPLQQSLFDNFSWFPLFSSEPLGSGNAAGWNTVINYDSAHSSRHQSRCIAICSSRFAKCFDVPRGYPLGNNI